MAGHGAHYSAPVDECEKPVNIVAVVQVETCEEPKESLKEKIHEKHEEVKDKIAEKHLEKEEEKYLKDHKVDAYLLPTGNCDESVLVVVEPEESLKDKIHDKGHEIKEKIHGHKHA